MNSLSSSFFVAGVQAVIFFFLFTCFKERKNLLRIDTLTLTLFVFAGIVLLSDLMGIDKKTSLLGSFYRHQGFLTVMSGILFATIIHSFSRKQREETYSLFQKGAYMTVLFLGLLIIYQAVEFHLFKSASIPSYNNRLIATFGNPNFLGGYVAMILPFLLFIKTRKYLMPLRILSLILSFVIVFFADSRAAFLSVSLIVFVFMLPSLPLRIRPWAIVCGALLFLAVSSLYFFSDNSRESIWDNRTLIWTEGINAVLEKPVLGYGRENFELIYPQERNTKIDNAHNIFLETTIASGLIGLGVFLALLIISFKNTLLPLKLSLLAFLITAQFNPLSIAQIALFWFLVGMSGKRGEEP